MKKTLFINPPSFDGFDGGANSRYQAKREITSFWYPTWLAQPAALVPGSKPVYACDLDIKKFRNPVLSYLSAERLLIIYGNRGLDGVIAEIRKLNLLFKILNKTLTKSSCSLFLE